MSAEAQASVVDCEALKAEKMKLLNEVNCVCGGPVMADCENFNAETK